MSPEKEPAGLRAKDWTWPQDSLCLVSTVFFGKLEFIANLEKVNRFHIKFSVSCLWKHHEI